MLRNMKKALKDREAQRKRCEEMYQRLKEKYGEEADMTQPGRTTVIIPSLKPHKDNDKK